MSVLPAEKPAEKSVTRPAGPVTFADLGVPAYAIDEQTAITVVDGAVEVVSEGQWTKFG